jgi:CRISPR-associated protein Cas5d
MTKHLSIAQRMVQKGGRRDIFLGLRKCQGYVLPVEYGSTPGVYDQMEYLDFGMMFHGFNYADETGKNLFQSRFWQATMQHGVIKFIKPQECSLVRDIRAYQAKEFSCEEVRS